MASMCDVAVVGSGPNGLTAAVELARRGLRVEVFEARETVGGGARTESLTLPGFQHDSCSAVHPLGVGSPAFLGMAEALARHGLEWLHPELPMAHPFPDGRAAVLADSAAETAHSLGSADAARYLQLMAPFAGRWEQLAQDFLTVPWRGLPTHPWTLARFGMVGLPPVALLMRWFSGDRAKALMAGLAAHVIAPLTTPASAGIALVFALAAQERGWPIPRGGSQAISNALAGYLAELGGAVHTGVTVRRLDELPPARAYLFDTSPTAMAEIAGLGDSYRRFRYGAAAFKVDYALDGPVPWAAPDAARAGTVHIGPTSGEIDRALRAASGGREAPDTPFLITSQPSLVDPGRAPDGQHVFWAYGHVPNGWKGDLTDAIERQLERFAPGFRDRVLARAVAGPPDLAQRNANYVGGDVACGAFTGLQTVFRPRPAYDPYATRHPSVFLCSSATWPGPGVHGMCGQNAARSVFRRLSGRG